jgi:transcriptional regulator with XRE-family HTH domain
MTLDQERDSPSARAPADGGADARGGPTAQRIVLGAQLRRLREAASITPGQAGDAIRASRSKISRLERGQTGVKKRDLADLLILYGVTGQAEREELLILARQASAPGWWQQYNDILPKRLERYIGLERAASVIRTYEVQFVPGLMQTEDYARAVILLSNPGAPPDETDRRVSLRMQRQQLLTEPGAPQLWAVLDETALRRPQGGRHVMRAQFEHLLRLTDLPNVTLQIVPFRSGPPAAAGGPFTILRFPEPDLPDVVYIQHLSGALYLDQADDVTTYLAVIDQLCVQAETGPASQDMLRALLTQA